MSGVAMKDNMDILLVRPDVTPAHLRPLGPARAMAARMKRISAVAAVLLILSCSTRTVYSFAPFLGRSRLGERRHRRRVLLRAKEGNQEDDGRYRFGDISRGLAKKFVGSVEKTTGKPYEFGDLSRHLDKKAKEKVGEFTGKDSYTPGDISKEIVKRALSGDYKLEDLTMLAKVLVAIGASFSPAAGALPSKILIELLEVSVATQIGEKVVGAVTTELDRRMKEAVTGNPDYKLGDYTKGRLMKWIGKDGDGDKYEVGDITKTVLRKYNSNSGDATTRSSMDLTDGKVLAELEEWDRALSKSVLDDDEKKSAEKK